MAAIIDDDTATIFLKSLDGEQDEERRGFMLQKLSEYRDGVAEEGRKPFEPRVSEQRRLTEQVELMYTDSDMFYSGLGQTRQDQINNSLDDSLSPDEDKARWANISYISNAYLIVPCFGIHRKITLRPLGSSGSGSPASRSTTSFVRVDDNPSGGLLDATTCMV